MKYIYSIIILFACFTLKASVLKDWTFWIRSASEYYEKGKNAESLRFLDSAIVSAKVSIDTNSMNYAAFNAMYGHNLLALKQYERALKYFNKALAIIERSEYKESDISDLYEGMGLAYAGLNMSAEAESYFFKNYSYSKSKFGADSPELSNATLNLAYNSIKAKSYEKALLSLQECLQIRETIFGKTDKNLLEPISAMVEIYDSLGRTDEYERALIRALEIKVKNYGKIAVELVPELTRLSALYIKTKRPLDLEKIYLSLIKVYEQIDERDATFTAELYVKLAELCKAQNIANRTQIYFDKAVEKIKYYNCETKKAAGIYASAAMYYATGKLYDKAVYYFNESIELLEKKSLQSSDDYFTIVNNAAALCVSIDDYDKAFAYFAKAEKVLIDNPQSKVKYANNLYLNIAFTYKKLANIEKYDEYMIKAGGK